MLDSYSYSYYTVLVFFKFRGIASAIVNSMCGQLDDYSYLLELANKAPELFKKATFEEKRKLIKKVLSNLLLDADLLRWKYKKPFNLMAFCNVQYSWLGMRDSTCVPQARKSGK